VGSNLYVRESIVYGSSPSTLAPLGDIPLSCILLQIVLELRILSNITSTSKSDGIRLSAILRV
ncbi:hypothetical protein U1Q18_051030, partial [Sarracenia purpurea var. burkii]